MMGLAKQVMQQIGAGGLMTGEVLNQRPASQTYDKLLDIDQASGLHGKLLRPLSARNLPITEIEKSGILNRRLLGDINGQSRKKQMALAKEVLHFFFKSSSLDSHFLPSLFHAASCFSLGSNTILLQLVDVSSRIPSMEQR